MDLLYGLKFNVGAIHLRRSDVEESDVTITLLGGPAEMTVCKFFTSAILNS